jgi:hypothetical protein
MMRKSPIKVKLRRDLGGYLIVSITNAVTIGSFNGQILRVGDAIDEKQAEHLTHSYLVAVTHK